MNKGIVLIVVVAVVGLILAGYMLASTKSKRPAPLCPSQLEGGTLGMPNPAAVYCKSLGYKFEIVSTEEGEVGYCVFPDGSRCKAWDFFNGKCGQEWSYCERYGKGRIVTESCAGPFSTECAVCILPDGTKCREWEFCSGKCP